MNSKVDVKPPDLERGECVATLAEWEEFKQSNVYKDLTQFYEEYLYSMRNSLEMGNCPEGMTFTEFMMSFRGACSAIREAMDAPDLFIEWISQRNVAEEPQDGNQ